jgi:cytochrome c553
VAVAFLAAWALLGLAIFWIALRGGPRGARAALQSQSRGGRRVAGTVLGAFFVVFGVGIPAVVLATHDSDKSKRGPAGLELTEAQVNGRSLFSEQCATCHALDAARAEGRVGPDLDAMRPPRSLILNAIKEGRARGAGQMPAELVEGKDAADVAAFVAAVAGR